MEGWTSIILAGGQSRRMGQSKPFVPVEGQPLVQRMVELTLPFSKEVIIVGRAEEREALRACLPPLPQLLVITDRPPFQGKGPLAGMHAGMKERRAPYYFVCACDLPCLDGGFLAGLQELVKERGGYEAYIPLEKGRYQPFAAVYQDVSAAVEELLLAGQYKWQALLSKLKHYYLISEGEWRGWSTHPHPFFNMNTPEDYNKIRSGWV